MTGTLDDIYLSWLYSQVGDVKVRNTSKTYWELFRQMYDTKFVWLIPNDDNRIQDGLDLRHEFLVESGFDYNDRWLNSECSFLEMVLALSRRLAFEGEGHPPVWFWHLMENLGLQHCTDRSAYDKSEVDARLGIVIWRLYEPDGRGGLFPLRHPKHDQTQVELWYQMNEYLLDA